MRGRIFFFAMYVIAACVGMSGCDKDDDTDYSEAIIGTWTAVSEEGEELLTDNVFINTFSRDMKAAYASIVPVEDGFEWEEEAPGNYRLEGDILYEWGEYKGKSYTYKTRIKISDNLLICQTLESIYDGQPSGTNTTYTMARVVNDYTSQFIGVWKGHETTAGLPAPPENEDTYWEYKPDGSYQYYYWDKEQSKYIKKADNNGKYFLYGTLMAGNYTNDLISGGTGRTCECWRITISGGTMTWKGLRKGGEIKEFTMTKVSSPPVTN